MWVGLLTISDGWRAGWNGVVAVVVVDGEALLLWRCRGGADGRRRAMT